MYKSKSILLVGMLLGAAVFSGCDEKEKQPDIKVENGSLSQIVYADETIGKNDVTFVTSGAWTSAITEGTTKSTKSGSVSWLSIDPDHGDKAGSYTVSISLEPNATSEDRTATITITCNGKNITITVTQKATKEDGTPIEKPVTGVDVYVVGSAYNEKQGNTIAKLWKNGVAQTLTSPSTSKGNMPDDSWANSIYVSGNDVYVAGVFVSTSCGMSIVWKNGTAQSLGCGSASSVFVSGNDVYVAGDDHNDWSSPGVVWKNGVAQKLGNGMDDRVSSIFVSGSDVYVAGTNNRRAAIWKNGVVQQLEGNFGYAYVVYVSGSDVYVSGGDGDKIGIVWKNGIPQSLPASTFVTSFFVSGSDVYMSGVEYGWEGNKAIVWKNGTQQYLTGNDSGASSVFVLGSDVYVSGRADKKAVLWKNGVMQNLTTSNDNEEQATSLFVVERK